MDTHEVTVALQEGMHFTSEQDDQQTINIDAKADFGGMGKGARPQKLMLVSLGSCTGIDVISILNKKRQDVTAFAIDVSGDRAENHPRIYTEIRVHYRVTGYNIDPKAVERAIELSINKYCPVANLLAAAVPIITSYEITNA